MLPVQLPFELNGNTNEQLFPCGGKNILEIRDNVAGHFDERLQQLPLFYS